MLSWLSEYSQGNGPVCQVETLPEILRVYRAYLVMAVHKILAVDTRCKVPYQRLAPLIPLEFTGEYSATARRAAVTRVRGGANLNCTSQLRAIFSHPYTAYRQLKFCVQSLLDRLYKHSKFQVRFRPDKPDHSLVRQQQ
jgi:hypothetical protein